MKRGRLGSFSKIALVSVFLFAGCTAPPPMHQEEAAAVVAGLLSVASCPFTAFGEMAFSLNGETYHCAIETSSSGPGELEADFIGPFGITLASLHASGGSGVITLQGKQKRFDSTTSIDELLQMQGNGRFTFAEVEPLLEGMVPAVWRDPLRRQPDSIINESRTIRALWKTDSIKLHAQIHKKHRQMEVLEFLFDSGEQVVMGAIKNGRAHLIEMHETDGSYIIVNYEQLKCR